MRGRFNLKGADRSAKVEMNLVNHRRAATVDRPAFVPFHHTSNRSRVSDDRGLNDARLFARRRQLLFNRENVAGNAELKRCPFAIRNRIAWKTTRVSKR